MSDHRRPVPRFPGYTVDRDGVVWGKRGNPLRPRTHHRTGHLRVRLYASHLEARASGRDGRQRAKFADVYVHQLVCLAFHGPAPFPDAVVRHLDDDPQNNTAQNLAWGTYADNERDKHRPPWVDAQGFDWRYGIQLW